MKKIQAHILKIKKWNQELDKIEEEKINLLNEIETINETENTQQITSNNLKPLKF
ncbi:hypothetical protein [Spiroplasma ixodetis]|uniref:hypothetical protein n=1 Tax=Spiroplasma ixodetis TaxID=2141 RepID=UPI001AED9840|nr:hypothetical protein [Spiroplasma ixodetis]WJG71332.1 hypothetical protein SIXOD_v1c27390 [Spiroplasma ixodetis Y32]